MIKSAVKYLGRFCLIYILLAFFFNAKPVNRVHRSIFMGSAEVFLKMVFPKAFIIVKHGVKQAESPEMTVRIIFNDPAAIEKAITNARQNNPGMRRVNVRNKEFTISFDNLVLIPIVFLLSLVLITPIPLRKKLWTIAWALALLYLFILLKLSLFTLVKIDMSGLGIYQIGEGVKPMVRTIDANLQIGASIIVSVFIWIILTFQKSSWQKLLTNFGGEFHKTK